MLNNSISATMQTQIDKFMSNVVGESAIASVTLLFTSPRNPDLKIYISREIDKLTIKQDFIRNFTDKITAELTLMRDPYLTLYYLRKDLYCRLQITYATPERMDEETKAPDIDILYKCAIIKYEDIFKKISKEKVFPEQRSETDQDHIELKMTVELIEDVVYKARKQQFHGITRDVTMEDMLRYTVNFFGLGNALIVPPDNKRKYTNFVIPPAYGIESIMSFLQTAPGLGVYDNGFSSYIMNGCWYIYPRFGSPVTRKPIHVYSVGGGMFTGLDRYDYQDGEELHLLTTNGLNEKNWSDLGTENAPTGASVHMSDLVLDGTRKLIADDQIELNPQVSYYANIPSDPIDMENYVRVKFMPSNSNLQTIKSSLRTFHGRTINFKWNLARPWNFRPATIVQLHFDGADGYETAECICEAATYTFDRDKTKPLLPRFVCTGDITLNSNNIKK